MNTSLIIFAYYLDGEAKEFITDYSQEAILETFEYAYQHHWTYVVLENGSSIPLSGLEEILFFPIDIDPDSEAVKIYDISKQTDTH